MFIGVFYIFIGWSIFLIDNISDIQKDHDWLEFAEQCLNCILHLIAWPLFLGLKQIS